jgi:hypothetical protein
MSSSPRRTGTHRAQKAELEQRGVTAATWDREKEMVDPVLRKA